MADSFRIEGNTIIERVPGRVWTLDGSLKYNFVPPHIARFPCRMAVIKLDGGLIVWSPLPPKPEVLSQVEALGIVRWIVAPNSLHWMWAGKFAAALRKAGGQVPIQTRNLRYASHPARFYFALPASPWRVDLVRCR